MTANYLIELYYCILVLCSVGHHFHHDQPAFHHVSMIQLLSSFFLSSQPDGRMWTLNIYDLPSSASFSNSSPASQDLHVLKLLIHLLREGEKGCTGHLLDGSYVSGSEEEHGSIPSQLLAKLPKRMRQEGRAVEGVIWEQVPKKTVLTINIIHWASATWFTS